MAGYRQVEIAAELREKIVEGRFKPGGRLPTRQDLEREFQTSPTTMQRVFDQLVADGIVESRGRAGTFVAERPPHLTHYALVLHGAASESRYYRNLGSVAMEEARGGRRISSYFQVNGRFPSGDHERLQHDLENHLLAGVIFGTHPYDLAKSPLMTAPGIPRVAIMTDNVYPDMPTIYPDLKGFYRRALEHVAAQGRRRVAFVEYMDQGPEHAAQLQPILGRLGLETRPEWTLMPNPARQVASRLAVQLLLSLPEDQRPDALIVADDNLVEAATAGVHASGLPAGALDVVGLCNYPDIPTASVPFTRLGFDFAAMLRHCLACIDDLRRGRQPLSHVDLPALFQDELPQGRPTQV